MAGTVVHGASTNMPVDSSVALGAAGTDTISGVREIDRQRLRRRRHGGNTSALNMEYEGFRGGGGNDTFFGGGGFDEAKYDDGNCRPDEGRDHRDGGEQRRERRLQPW